MKNLDFIIGLKFATASQAHLCRTRGGRSRNWFKAMDIQCRIKGYQYIR